MDHIKDRLSPDTFRKKLQTGAPLEALSVTMVAGLPAAEADHPGAFDGREDQRARDVDGRRERDGGAALERPHRLGICHGREGPGAFSAAAV